MHVYSSSVSSTYNGQDITNVAILQNMKIEAFRRLSSSINFNCSDT